jgi:peptidoglycan/LPS O-acetylase OafA/YrhL
MLMHMFVNHLLWILVVFFISPPLLSLLLLRRPSFWRVLLHVVTAFYILWIVYIFFTYTTPPNLLWKYVTSTFLLVYSGAALVAGLPEATAASRRARLVYYAALLFWLFLAVALLS